MYIFGFAFLFQACIPMISNQVIGLQVIASYMSHSFYIIGLSKFRGLSGTVRREWDI